MQKELRSEETPTMLAIAQQGLNVAYGFKNLFFKRKFIAHRIFGLSYLIQFFYVVYLYFKSYDSFLASNVIITMPITGVVQSVTAMYYFRFLPKKQVDPGDKAAMSYALVCENLFFAMLLCFQWLYYNPRLTEWFRYFWVIESLFVFLPYTWRGLFPKTSFRDSMKIEGKKTSPETVWFYYIGTHITKAFYLWAKFYIGFFLNYLMFIGAVDEHARYCVYTILLPSAVATTVALFLHTLRFKRYLAGTTSFSLYVISYMCTFWGWSKILYVFWEYQLLSAVCFVGAIINVRSLNTWHVYQAALMLMGYSGLLREEAWDGVSDYIYKSLGW